MFAVDIVRHETVSLRYLRFIGLKISFVVRKYRSSLKYFSFYVKNLEDSLRLCEKIHLRDSLSEHRGLSLFTNFFLVTPLVFSNIVQTIVRKICNI